MEDYKPGQLVDFRGTTYSIVKREGDALTVKRSGAHEPISIPINEAHLVLREGRTNYDISQKLNG